MTERYYPRKGKPLPVEQLYPNSGAQKLLVGKIQYILQKKGMLEGTAYQTAIEIWRLTRR